MKYIMLIPGIFFCHVIAFGQAQVFTYTERDTKVEGKHYRFPEFKDGIITRTNGEPIKAQLNYNLATEEIVVDLGHTKTPYAINDQIQSIMIDTLVFVHHDGIIYEELYSDSSSLLVHRLQKLSRLGQNTGLGRTGSISSKELPPDKAMLYELIIPGTFESKDINTHFVRQKDQWSPLTKVKDIYNIFPAISEELKTFIKDERIRMQKEDDLIRLIKFCNEKVR